jgi:hypothetical protein
LKVHPDTIKSVLTPHQRLCKTGKPTAVATSAYSLVDSRGKTIKIGDEVAVGYGRAGIAVYKIKGLLEYAMEICERIPVPGTRVDWTGKTVPYTNYTNDDYPTDAVTYVVILDSPGSMKRDTDEVYLVA